MRFLSFSTGLLFLVALTSAAPTFYKTSVSNSSEIFNGTIDCPSLVQASTKADFNWSSSNPVALALAQECLQSHIPPTDACVFYTSNSRDKAILFAAQRNKQTIYDIYPAHWFNTSTYPADKWVKNGVLRNVFRVTSRNYAISCSGSATVVIPSGESPCRTSIWVTDELDVIRSHLSKITEIFRASLVERIGGYWDWVVSKLTLDGENDGGDQEMDRKIELRKRSKLLQDVVGVSSLLESEARLVVTSRLEMLKEYGAMAEEWAVSNCNRCN